jgi:hypothetical protein
LLGSQFQQHQRYDLRCNTRRVKRCASSAACNENGKRSITRALRQRHISPRSSENSGRVQSALADDADGMVPEGDDAPRGLEHYAGDLLVLPLAA